MKRIFMLLLAVTVIPYVFAAKERLAIHHIEKNGQQGFYAFQCWIDRDNKKFWFDSDSEDEANMLIKNYKQQNSKETFDVYPEADPNTKHCSITIESTPSGSKITFKYSTYTNVYIAVPTKEKNAKPTEVISKENTEDNIGNKMKKGISNLVKKGKNALKKK